MLHYLIMCRSLTYAQRAVRALAHVGISAFVMKAPAYAVSGGCAYCVRIPENRLTHALGALKSAGLQPGRVFIQTNDGLYREAQPNA